MLLQEITMVYMSGVFHDKTTKAGNGIFPEVFNGVFHGATFH